MQLLHRGVGRSQVAMIRPEVLTAEGRTTRSQWFAISVSIDCACQQRDRIGKPFMFATHALCDEDRGVLTTFTAQKRMAAFIGL